MNTQEKLDEVTRKIAVLDKADAPRMAKTLLERQRVYYSILLAKEKIKPIEIVEALPAIEEEASEGGIA